MDLEELRERFFRETRAELERLVAVDTVSYLHPSKQWEYPWALEQVDLSPGSRVLDAGCGASIFPIYLAKLSYLVSAADLSPPTGLPDMHGVHVSYVSADLTRLPWKEGTFDAVFCISVLEHLPRAGMPAAMQEMRRVLKTGGRLLLTTDYFVDHRAKIRYEGPGEPFEVDWSFFDRDLLEEIVLDAPGFDIGGGVDLEVRWDSTIPRMKRFHGYPYTSVGVPLVKKSP
jgi:SAM-dependent methyltransferase